MLPFPSAQTGFVVSVVSTKVVLCLSAVQELQTSLHSARCALHREVVSLRGLTTERVRRHRLFNMAYYIFAKSLGMQEDASGLVHGTIFQGVVWSCAAQDALSTVSTAGFVALTTETVVLTMVLFNDIPQLPLLVLQVFVSLCVSSSAVGPLRKREARVL